MTEYIYDPPDYLLDSIKTLFREYVAWLGLDLSFQDFERELEELPGKYSKPGGALILAIVDSVPAGCVALRDLGSGCCEMKRLYTGEAFRGKGIGKSLVCRILAESLALGYDKMLLDTLSPMKSAISIYEACGFRRRSPYYNNPLEGAVFMELDLSDKTAIRERLVKLSVLDSFSAKKDYEYFIFDYGCVISLEQRAGSMRKMAEIAGADDLEKFSEAYRNFRHDYDKGILDGKQYWKKVSEASGSKSYITGLEESERYEKLIRLDIESWSDINTETLSIIRELKSRGKKLAILSNMPPEMYRCLMGGIKNESWWLGLFDIHVFSCEAGICKPDAGIYRLCLEFGEMKPIQAVFIDDLEVNILGAGQCGIKGIRFTDANKLSIEINKLV